MLILPSPLASLVNHFRVGVENPTSIRLWLEVGLFIDVI